MYVERAGTGREAYLALHGWGSDRTAFAPLAARVPARATFYSADLPGYGRSPALTELTLDAVTDEVAATVRALDTARLTIVGNCGGAIFALLAAQRLAGVVRRVVMIDPFAYLPRYFRLFTAGEFGRHAYEATFANPVGRWLTNQSLRRRRTGAADLTASFGSVDHEVSRRYLVLFASGGRIERFGDVRAAVDIVYGARTFGAVRRSIPAWQRVLPHARVHCLAGAGHLPMVEATDELSRLVFTLDTTDDRKQTSEAATAHPNQLASETEAVLESETEV